jgi:hypothetical protein
MRKNETKAGQSETERAERAPIQAMYKNHLVGCKAAFFPQFSWYGAILLNYDTSPIRVVKQPKNSENGEFDRLLIWTNA